MPERKPTPELLGASAGRIAGWALTAWLTLRYGWWAFLGFVIWETLTLIAALSIRAWNFK